METLDLIIYGIVAVVFIGIALTLFGGLVKETPLITEIKENLVVAKNPTSIGQLISLGSKNIEKEFLLSKGMFETDNMSLAFECNNPKICCIRKSEQDTNYICTKAIEWDYDSIKSNATTLTKVGVRCITQDTLPVCRVYIGEDPAQAKIIDIQKTQNGQINTFSIKTKNIGENNLTNPALNLSLQKYVNGVWETTEDIFEPKYISTSEGSPIIMPRAEHTFVFEINPTTRGDYKAVFTYSGQNAGFDTLDINFIVGFNTACTPIIQSSYETIENEDGTVIETKKCENCNYAYECATVWQTKFPQNNYEVVSKDFATCTKISQGYITCEDQ